MRETSGPEVLLFARVLSWVEVHARIAVAARILQEVQDATLYMRSHNHCHPTFGDGSLMSRCLLLSPPAEPLATDCDFLASIMVACHALLHSKR